MFGVWRLYKTWISVTVQIEELWMVPGWVLLSLSASGNDSKDQRKCMGRSTSSNRTNLPLVTFLSPPETRNYFPRTTGKQWLHLDSALSLCPPPGEEPSLQVNCNFAIPKSLRTLSLRSVLPPLYRQDETMHLANKEKARLPFLSNCLGCIQIPEAVWGMHLAFWVITVVWVCSTVHWVTTPQIVWTKKQKVRNSYFHVFKKKKKRFKKNEKKRKKREKKKKV